MEVTSLASLLPSLSLNSPIGVEDASSQRSWWAAPGNSHYYTFEPPRCEFFCENCRGVRRFDGKVELGEDVYPAQERLTVLKYLCRDCSRYYRLVVLRVRGKENIGHAEIEKIVEWPRVGEPIDETITTALGEWANLFEKGWKCEQLGLGAGAFTYYRAVVEHSFRALLANIARILEDEGAEKSHVDAVHSAAKEHQFSKAVNAAKEHLPGSLLILSQNPLTLLHGLLSYDLHAADDVGALEKATDIREVLTLLIERVRVAIEQQERAAKSLKSLLKMQQKNRAGDRS
ncbi:MAG: hypothetical protein KDB32_13305 [Planctomycetes bacterium]|nr:hypothetical protein [Planctomycetota bacterium]